MPSATLGWRIEGKFMRIHILQRAHHVYAKIHRSHGLLVKHVNIHAIAHLTLMLAKAWFKICRRECKSRQMQAVHALGISDRMNIGCPYRGKGSGGSPALGNVGSGKQTGAVIYGDGIHCGQVGTWLDKGQTGIGIKHIPVPAVQPDHV